MKKYFLLALFVLAFVPLVFGAQKSRIELKDGSTLEGEVVSVTDGIYTIKSPSLGTLKIGESKIHAVRSADPSVAAPRVQVSPDKASEKDAASYDEATVQNEVQKIAPKIMNDPDILKAIPALMSDPDFQSVFEDPEVMKAVKAMDLKALMANEKFIKAANNPAIREISQKVKEKK